jgi:MYXO-CTERM domain-containing protein
MARSLLHTCAVTLAAAWLATTAPALAAPGPGLGNIDCTEAEKFKPLAFLENTQGGPTGSNVVIMTGGYLMLNYAVDSGGPPGILTFFDVSNPRQPRSVRRIDTADTRQFRESHSFPIAIIDGKHYVAIQTLRGIQFWDVTDAATAAKVGNIDLPGVNGGDYENVSWQTTWQGRYLFVSGGNLGVFVVDAANPAQPRLVKTLPTGQSGGFRVGPLYALGDYLVISNMDQNGVLGVLDISKADAPTLLTTKTVPLRMYAFIVAGDRIYGAGRDGDFTIHSWADPTRITDVKVARIEQDSLYVAAQDQFAFSGRQNNFVKIDLTDEKNPRIVGEGTLNRANPDHGQVTPFGNLIYIGNDHGTGSALFCHQTGKDVTPPGILKVFPSDRSTNQPLTSRITVSWSDYVDMRTVSSSTIAIRPVGGTALRGIYSFSFNTLSFGPEQPFAADTTYEIVISGGGIKDVMGNAVASERIVRFSTGDSIDVAPPGPDAGPDGSSGAGGTSSGGSSAGGASGNGGASGSGGASGNGGASGGNGGASGGNGGASGNGGTSGPGGTGGPGGSGGSAAAGGSAANRGGPGGPAVDDSQGCGCRTSAGSASSAALTALLALGLLLRRRRA